MELLVKGQIEILFIFLIKITQRRSVQVAAPFETHGHSTKFWTLYMGILDEPLPIFVRRPCMGSLCTALPQVLVNHAEVTAPCCHRNSKR